MVVLDLLIEHVDTAAARIARMVGGNAALIKPYKSIGHGLCAEACRVGAIKLVRAPRRV